MAKHGKFLGKDIKITFGGQPVEHTGITKFETTIGDEDEVNDDSVLEEEWAKDNTPTSSVMNVDSWEKEQGWRLIPKECDENGTEDDPPTHSPADPDDIGVDTYADCFAAAFRQYPKVEQESTWPAKNDFFNTLLESPDFHVLHQSTCANMMASDMATVTFVRQLGKLQSDLNDKEDKRRKLPKEYHRDPEQEAFEDHITCLRQVGRAIKKAQVQVDELIAMCNAFGSDPGTNNPITIEKIKEQYRKVKDDTQLKRIIELAGRYRFSAQSRQRNKVKHGYDDMVGIELGGDIGKLLPLEMARLADPDFEMDAMRRIVERQAMVRQYHGKEPQAKGPVVVCIDESGSMAGERIANAKAFALAMYWIARKQKRQMLMFGFSAGPDFTSTSIEWRDKLTRKGNVINAKESVRKPMDFPSWLSHFYNGGTDLEVCCRVIPDIWNKFPNIQRGKTDMIIVTDACLSIPDDLKTKFLTWKKKEDVKVQTIVIGSSEGVMGQISDQVHAVNCMSVDDISTQNAFSI